MYELFNRLLCYNIKEGPSLPCGTFTTTAPADEKFSHRSHPNHTGSSARKYQLLPAAFWSFSFFGSQICISQLCKKTLISGSWNALALGAEQRARDSLPFLGLPFLLLTASCQSSAQKCTPQEAPSQTVPVLGGWWCNKQACAGACLGGWGEKDCTFSPQHHPSSWLPHWKEKQKVGNSFFACTSCLLSPPGWGSLESVSTITGTRKLNAFCCFDHIGIISHAIHFAHIQDSRVGFQSPNLR